MRVLVEAECKVAEGIGGVARLFEGTKHEIGDDALLGLSVELFQEALVMVRGDAQLRRTREGHAHGAFAAVTVGIGAAGLGGSGNTAMANGDFALLEIFDAKRIAKSAGQFLEFEDLPRVWFFVNAMERRNAAAQQVAGNGAVSGEHEFLDQAM